MNVTDLPERIAKKIAVDATTGCWDWTAALNSHGYGEVYWLGSPRGSHRIVYSLLVGPVPVGLDLDHLCRVRHCVNPEHLEPVTRQENLLRGARCCITHCPQGHEYTPENTRRDRDGRRRCRECNRIRCAARTAA